MRHHSRHRLRLHLIMATAAAAALALVSPSAATADQLHPRLSVLTTEVFAPFNIDPMGGSLLVADGGPEVVAKLTNGTLTPLVTDVPGASGVAHHGNTLAYTSTVSDPTTFENTESGLNIKTASGTVYADTHAFEVANNPDSINTYGIAHPTACQRNALGPEVQYPGGIDSHAYSVTAWGNKWIVADAGANALFLIDNQGHISTLAVLPPQPAVITKEFADANHVPACVVGATYGFEPVPTDVEIGRNGKLFVTTLPGGPEGPELGARGAVWRVNPWSGKVTKIAGGFAGATNLAIGPKGRIYVAELFGGTISYVRHHQPHLFVDLPGVVALEQGNRTGLLFAGTLDPTFAGPGSIVEVCAGCHAHRVWS